MSLQPDAVLDEILALQLTIVWAGEGRCQPRRLGWWETDLIESHRWASLEAVREAAHRVDAKARGKMADPDAVRSLFFLGFEVDEQLNDRLAFLKRQGTVPAEALPLARGLGTEPDKVVRRLFDDLAGELPDLRLMGQKRL